MSHKKTPKGLPEVIYYRDELHDEFSVAEITPRPIDGSYQYDRAKGLARIARFFWYRVVAMPIAFFYLKLKFRHKIVGKKAFKKAKKQGFFIYGNHTQIIGDALIPSFVRFPHDAYVIVHANNVSMPYLGRVTPYMGALPLPDDMEATRNFIAIIEKRLKQKKSIFIYPEAHIWPYYTDIRDFSDKSFSYPARLCTPVFCFTNVYKRGVLSARIITYIDGPFYPDKSLSLPERRRALRDQVFCAMKKQAEKSDFEKIRYIKKEDSK